MATPFTGRYCVIALSSGTSGYVNNLGRWEININMDELDASDFGTVWKKNMTGQQGWNGSIEGFFDPSTAGHQMISLLNGALDATKIQDIRFYLNTATSMFFWPAYTTIAANGYSTDYGAYISNVRITAEKNNLIGFSCNVLGYGAIALFNATSAGATALVEGT